MNLELRLKEIKARLEEIRGLVDSETDVEDEECSENIAKSFGCDWYDTKRKCMSPFEFDNLLAPQFFPRSSSLHYKHRGRKN